MELLRKFSSFAGVVRIKSTKVFLCDGKGFEVVHKSGAAGRVKGLKIFGGMRMNANFCSVRKSDLMTSLSTM